MPEHTITDFRGEHEFLSNFYRAPFYFNGCQYPTAEHAFQVAKMLTVADKQQIVLAPTPAEAKRLGRAGQKRPGWDHERKAFMLRICLAKFGQLENLGDRLLATGDALLVEGNGWHDQDWGDCRCGRPACAAPGRNWLGQILMTVRFVLWDD